MTSKKTVAVIFGGASAEHDVSIMSAKSIVTHLDATLYDVLLIGFDKANTPYHIKTIDTVDSKTLFEDKAPLSKTAWMNLLIEEADVVFPIIHGPGGEDGKLQGVFRYLNLPFVGADVTASALCMDKRLAKEVLKANGFNQCKHMSLHVTDFEGNLDEVFDQVEQTLGYPVFVKPSNMGSSIGIVKVSKRDQLKKALEIAFNFDKYVLIEQGVNARELECGVLGNAHPQAMAVGEIVSSHEFYDYEAKYSDASPSELIVPAVADDKVIEEIKREAVRAYKVLGVEGLCRIDFFVDRNTQAVMINELNTLPGFTAYSMYPMLCAQEGIAYTDLLSQLIELALRRDA